MRKYRHLLEDGWSRPESLARFMAAAGRRVIPGRGPFTLLVEGEKSPIIERKSRIRVLRRLHDAAKARRFGTLMRVRNRKQVFFTGRPVNVVPPVRSETVKWARWMVNRSGYVHYSQRRPYSRYPKGYRGSMYMDCSAAYANVARWAGARDPYGNGFNGSGSSYELHASPTIARSNALPGDSISWNGHVVMLLEAGHRHDPLVFSHGQESGPYAYRLSTAVRIHGSSYRCHRLPF